MASNNSTSLDADSSLERGAMPEIRSPEEFGAVFLSSYRLWRDVVKSIGLPMQ